MPYSPVDFSSTSHQSLVLRYSHYLHSLTRTLGSATTRSTTLLASYGTYTLYNVPSATLLAAGGLVQLYAAGT
eukprot:scaffold5466_cov42-Attheya_sp.AAC.1